VGLVELQVETPDVLGLLLEYRHYIRRRLGLSDRGYDFHRRRAGPEDLRNTAITLLAILNNLRPSEAIECMRMWLENPKPRRYRLGKGKICVVPAIIDWVDYRVTKATGLPSIHEISKWVVRLLGVPLEELRVKEE
jgi:hypothetical protein